MFSWGDREHGVCGHGEEEGHQLSPRRIENVNSVTSVSGISQLILTHLISSPLVVSACGFHTAAVTRMGDVFTWGEGKFGRLGHGEERNFLQPELVGALEGRKVLGIACGGFHAVCVTGL